MPRAKVRPQFGPIKSLFCLSFSALLCLAGAVGCASAPPGEGDRDTDASTIIDDTTGDDPTAGDDTVDPAGDDTDGTPHDDHSSQDGDGQPAGANRSPMAIAGGPGTAQPGDPVELDASDSYDDDGDELTFAWRQTGGEPVSDLEDASAASAFFTAPETETSISLTFVVTVSDGTASSEASVMVIVEPAVVAAGTVVTADAGEDQEAFSGDQVTLTGSTSDGQNVGATFFWEQSAGASVTLSDPQQRVVTFVATDVSSGVAIMIFRLTVTRGGVSSSDSVMVSVSPEEISVGGNSNPNPSGGNNPPPPPPPPPPVDDCPNDPAKTSPGACGCGVADTDSDGDGNPNCTDGCPSDPAKTSPGACGCGVADTDSDSDGTANCTDGCPSDAAKTASGICGCGVPDTDTDSDGTPNCNDGCPSNPAKIAPGVCGCGTADTDGDGDGTPNCVDGCPSDPLKIAAGTCGCGTADTDSDGDGVPNCIDQCTGQGDTDSDGDGTPNCLDGCPSNPAKVTPGVCGCSTADTDGDGDGTPNCIDGCPTNPAKIAPGVCGCSTADTDSDSDGTPNCNDGCPTNPGKVTPGVCGCSTADTDSDSDGTPNCNDGCPTNPAKIAPGVCGCSTADTDGDGDGTPNCVDGCPTNPAKIAPGVCGCSSADTDSDSDGTPNCNDGCPTNPAKIAPGVCGCSTADTDSDGDGTPNCNDGCPTNPSKVAPGVCGCSTADTDSDGDGTPNCNDGCPTNPAKIAPGVCGCSTADTDSDGDGTPNCNDGCASDPAKTSAGQCGCGVADTDTDGDGTANCVDGCPNDPSTTSAADCAAGPATAESDWDLYMLRLVNRARIDPAGEAARIGSSVTVTTAPVPPLAYERLVGQSATKHNNWMHDNFGTIASGSVPDSFSHYETLNGASNGTAATGTPNFTGVNIGARMTATGFSWGSVGENIITNWSSLTITVAKSTIDSNHKGWWESAGHRANMLSVNYTAFGHHIEARSFAPPLGGLNAPFDNLMYGTQNFARPLSNPRNYVFGLVYRDRDGNGAWTPRAPGDPLREGVSSADVDVFVANTSTLVASDTTMGSGAFAVRLASGTYDVVFTSPQIPGGTWTIQDVVMATINVDAGDQKVSTGP